MGYKNLYCNISSLNLMIYNLTTTLIYRKKNHMIPNAQYLSLDHMRCIFHKIRAHAVYTNRPLI